MVSATKCVVCLNNIKSKIKITARNSLDEQVLITFLLRKLMWTPVTEACFMEFLQIGNPSEWGALCHICEKQVKEALDVHRKIMRMIHRINDIRQKLYAESFYDSDQEDDDMVEAGNENGDVFLKLRKLLLSDYHSKQWDKDGFRKSISLKYHTSTSAEVVDQDHDGFRLEQQIKCEYETDVENDYSDSMIQEDDTLPNLNDSTSLPEDGFDDILSDRINDELKDETWTAGKPKPRRKKITKYNSERIETPVNVPLGSKECPNCGKTFSNGSSMRRHFRENHLKAKDCKCPYCNQTFARREYLERHFQQRHPERFPNGSEIKKAGLYQCSSCTSKFFVASALRRHVRLVHRSSSTQYKCDKCESTYKRKDSLINHKKLAHPESSEIKDSDADKRTCKICGKTFQTETIMMRHVRESHDKIKEYGCDQCSKFFARKSYLFRHIQNEHMKSDSREPISCKICSKTCTGEAAYSRHMQIVHKKRENVTCQFCLKTYTQRAALNIHIKFTHGEETQDLDPSSSEHKVVEEDNLSTS